MKIGLAREVAKLLVLFTQTRLTDGKFLYAIWGAATHSAR